MTNRHYDPTGLGRQANGLAASPRRLIAGGIPQVPKSAWPTLNKWQRAHSPALSPHWQREGIGPANARTATRRRFHAPTNQAPARKTTP